MRLWLAAAAVIMSLATASWSGEEFPDFFNAAAMRRPLPGEWAEYRVAFPVDQLENSLRADPDAVPDIPNVPTEPAEENGTPAEAAAAPATALTAGAWTSDFTPMFEAPAAWRVLPLRLEIREVTDEGANALLTFGGMTHPVFLPLHPGNAAEAEFQYDPPGDNDDRRIFIKIGEEELEVDSLLRRTGDGEGFVRWTNADLLFGILRFATPDVDFMLVGHGRGTPPDFPLPLPTSIDPPLGRLWQSD